jgi:hypothetical protein
MVTGKCPGCGKVPTFGTINVQSVEVRGVTGDTWNGVIYVCPDLTCQTILGAGLDPLALKADTINGVVRELRKKGARL